MNLIRETFQAAIDKLATRQVVASNRNSAEWQDMPIAIRERSFWSATIEDVKFLQRMQDEISDYLSQETEEIPKSDEADGGTALKAGGRAVFIERMRELAIAEGMEPLDPADEGTIKDIRSEARLGLIFDTQVRMAQDYARYREGLQPDVLDAFPAQRFIREADREKPRDRSARYEGAVALKTNHKFWADTVNASKDGGFGTPYGPWGFGSGMDVEDVAREEVEAPEGESADPSDVRMTEGQPVWLLNPGQPIDVPTVEGFNDQVQASARGLSPASVQNLKDAFGSQIEITGDTMRWTPAPAARPDKGVPAKADPAPIAEKAKSLEDALAQAGWRKGEPVRPHHIALVRDIFSRNITAFHTPF